MVRYNKIVVIERNPRFFGPAGLPDLFAEYTYYGRKDKIKEIFAG